MEKDSSVGSSTKAAVIGAGIAGLAAARVLAQAGWQVDVFEKNDSQGGLCSTLVIDGFTFDFGPHVFNKSITDLVPFKSGDLEAATFSESFLVRNQFLRFPNDLLSPGYAIDMFAALAKNTLEPDRLSATNLEDLAKACYGEKVATEIFQPLIEKWCKAPLNMLDHRYLASRMHGKLTAESIANHLKSIFIHTWKRVKNTTGQIGESQKQAESVDPPGYSGRIGAKIIPHRLADGLPNVRFHFNQAVQSLAVDRGHVVRLQAGGMEIQPDFVINTAPLNQLAGMLKGENRIQSLAKVSYLNIIFVFARIQRPKLLNTEWTWIPEQYTPFYRMSEMKVFHANHAPEDATGLCLEITLADDDTQLKEPAEYWEKLTRDFLDRVFSLKSREIIGIDVVKKDFAYPHFTLSNTRLIGKALEQPYESGKTEHRFRTGIKNLAIAGRTGTFSYYLAPAAIVSGQKAAAEAIAFISGKT
ncbi:protoporphyrinogen/coproporphyrinogen oxidase [Desulfomonile tiedjei]|uniref:protoporphyrinogen/coproporphyrinogen oxidase n=1 Tax=Desulfomonile tiedjei TaxID=2358 RepID=UPI000302DCED|nr:FAD-dependent oxidoreductase [Desulfomonile tiedjei]